MRNLVAKLSEPLSFVEGKNEIIPVVVRFDLDGQLRQFVVGLFSTGGVQLGPCYFRFVARHRPPLDKRRGGFMNLPWRQTKLTRQFAGQGLPTTGGKTLESALPRDLSERHVGHRQLYRAEA